MAKLEPAVKFILENEDRELSGKVTLDQGGRTRFGIAEKFHPELGDEFYNGDKDAALEKAQEIYRDVYWEHVKGDQIEDQYCANKALDIAVNSGTVNSAHIIQKVVNAARHLDGRQDFITEDGVIGPNTIEAFNAIEPARAGSLLREFQMAFYRHCIENHPDWAKDRAGWEDRAAR